VKLFVDPISVRYLKGEVDFVDTVTGGGFTIKNRAGDVDLWLRFILQRRLTDREGTPPRRSGGLRRPRAASARPNANRSWGPS
jgi:hypothetical protein